MENEFKIGKNRETMTTSTSKFCSRYIRNFAFRNRERGKNSSIKQTFDRDKMYSAPPLEEVTTNSNEKR